MWAARGISTGVHSRWIIAVATALLLTWVSSVVAAVAPAKPHILLILADDLGFSDLGCYGGEIQTPNLDRLASNGLRFTEFYNTARCWPSRAALLTGYYAQAVRRDTVNGIAGTALGNRPSWAPLLPERLKQQGYRCYHSGKWHIDGRPLQNGFDHSYSLNDHDRHFAPRSHTEDDVALPSVAADAGYYTTTAIANHAIRCLDEHFRQHADRPFFEFLAFTAPHFPLQALPEDIARYKSTYLRGWDVLRQDRWKRMRALGIGGSTLSVSEPDVGPPYDFPDAMKALGTNEVNRPVPWNALTPSQQAFQAAKMAVHAAMVDRMDREIGRVLDTLRRHGAIDNTLVLFLSDNGASAEIMVRGDGHNPEAVCGTGATFLSLGPGWSTMANTPFRRHKTWVHEGGISTPLIAHWPSGIRSRGELREGPAHLVDLPVTLMELAGGSFSDTWNGLTVPTSPGKSLLPTLRSNRVVVHESLWWLHEGNRALRMGDWKIVAAGSEKPWELYNMRRDRAEMRNLASAQPERVREMAARWQAETARVTTLALGTDSH